MPEPGGSRAWEPGYSARRSTGRPTVACRRCGRQHPETFQCPFLNLTCWNCGRRGHAERVCPSPASAVRTMDNSVANQQGPPPAEPAGVGSDEEPSEEVYELYKIATEKKHPPIRVEVQLNGQRHTFELDTGASVSVCSERAYQRLWPSGQRPCIEPFEGRLRTYSGENLQVAGQIKVNVQYGADWAVLPLVVLYGDGPSLFGRDWLQHFRLDWPQLCKVTRCTELDAILARHSAVFQEGLGCYRGGEVSISVKEGVKPRFFRARQVPLAYRAKVNAELDRQIAAGLGACRFLRMGSASHGRTTRSHQ